MIKLTIGNSTCSLTGLTVTEFKAIRTVLSYTEQVRGGYRNSFHPVRRYLIDKKGNFPSGLLHLVQKFIADKRLQIQVVDNRRRPEPRPGMFTLRGFDL